MTDCVISVLTCFKSSDMNGRVRYRWPNVASERKKGIVYLAKNASYTKTILHHIPETKCLIKLKLDTILKLKENETDLPHQL